jgi:hypothetical protein
MKLKILAVAIVAVCCGVPLHAQTLVLPYADFGGGKNTLGFSGVAWHGDGGTDITDRRWFIEGEAGWDSQNPFDISDGSTIRAHGWGMYRVKGRWFVGGGIHYSRVASTPYQIHGPWPTVGGMYETPRFRFNGQYLVSVEKYKIEGPLFDLRIRIRRHWFCRERIGVYVYRDPLDPMPANHAAADFNVSLLYVFHEKNPD